MRYAIVIEDAGANVGAYAPDVPGVGITAPTAAEAIICLREALVLHFDALREDGTPIPQPATAITDLAVDVAIRPLPSAQTPLVVQELAAPAQGVWRAFPLVYVTAVRPLDAYRLWLRFSDGAERELDLWPFIADGPIFAAVRDPAVFRQVRVEGETITWPTGADLDPLVLRYYPALKPAGWA